MIPRPFVPHLLHVYICALAVVLLLCVFFCRAITPKLLELELELDFLFFIYGSVSKPSGGLGWWAGAAGHERTHSDAEQDGAAAQRGCAETLAGGENGRGGGGTAVRRGEGGYAYCMTFIGSRLPSIATVCITDIFMARKRSVLFGCIVNTSILVFMDLCTAPSGEHVLCSASHI